MAQPDPQIDIEILYKKIYGSLTPDEEYIFQRWISEDISHQKYFEGFQQNHLNKNNQAQKISTQKAWENISSNLRPNRRKYKWYLAAAVTLMLGSLFWLIRAQQDSTDTKIVAQVSKIVPGSAKAFLIASNGKRYTLGNKQPLKISQGNTQINSDGHSLRYQQEHQTGTDTSQETNTLIIPRGGQYEITLSDGTQVYLNAESKLTYPVQFHGGKRMVQLEGEAFFDVAHLKDIPFEVITQRQIIQVLGTAFNLHAYPDDSNTVTTLVRGKINVEATSEEKLSYTLSPGEQTVLNHAENGLLTKAEVDVYPFTAWKDGKFVFNNLPLAQILLTLSRWYDVQIIFEKEDLKDLRFTGEVTRYSNLSKILMLIEKTQEVNFSQKQRSIHVY